MKKTKICIPLIEDSVRGMQNVAARFEKTADLFEVRLDYLRDFNLEKLLTGIRKPVIVSCGFTEKSRRMASSKKLCLLQNAAKLGADYVDVDLSLFRDGDLPFLVPERTIVSYHNFKETPEDLGRIVTQMLKTSAGIIKIATRARSFSDNFRVLPLIDKIKRKGKQAIVFCMGETGQFSRILSPVHGAALTFAASTRGKESAPGQLAIEDYQKIDHFHQLNTRTTYTGLIGNRSDYPLALKIFNQLYQAEKLNFLFFPFLIKDVRDFFTVFRKERFAGVSIAYPYQHRVAQAMDRIGYPVRKTGLVTVAVKDDGLIKGFNSDVIAFQTFLEESLPVADKRCVVLGTARRWHSLLYVLKKMKAHITILGEDKDQAKKLAHPVGCGYDHIQQLGRQNFDILFFNSMIKKQACVEKLLEQVNKFRGRLFMDAGDFASDSPWGKEIIQSGSQYLNGLSVLERKILYEFKLFTGKESSESIPDQS